VTVGVKRCQLLAYAVVDVTQMPQIQERKVPGVVGFRVTIDDTCRRRIDFKCYTLLNYRNQYNPKTIS
jgi:hypothetical protein